MAVIVPLQESYQYCQRLTRSAARNFYFAFITLPAAKRKAIFAIYAFCRVSDDIIDEPAPIGQQMEQLSEMRRSIERAYAGEPEGLIFTALADVVSTYNIPQQHFQDIISGMEMDLTVHRYATFDDLYTYCYRVASAVGLICVEIFGYRDDRARQAAIDLGIAMQMTNIIRDVKEDAELGRIYLPQDELARFGYTEDELLRGIINEQIQALMRFQAERARGYFHSGGRLTPLLSPRSRACAIVLHGLYSRLLDRMEANGFNVFQGRTSLPTQEKLLLTARLWATSLLPRLRSV
jgi:phytoene synthase